MTLFLRYVLIFLASATLSCTTLGPAVARLADTLGREAIERITSDVLGRYLRERSRYEPQIVVETSFWPPVRAEIGETVGPQEGAEQFLETGFRRFLQSFEAHVTRETPDRGEVVFDDDNFVAFVRLARPRGCHGSPCDVPPCCGDGVRCWRCKPPRITIRDAG